jgi:alkylhydroperoxidase family enzyme
VSAHAHFLQVQGQNSKDVDEIGTLHLEKARLTSKEQALLDYVKVLTLEPANVRDTHVERLRSVGWTDEQIFEASFITSLFAFFNRMADAYGLDYSSDRWIPPDLRPSSSSPSTPPKR